MDWAYLFNGFHGRIGRQTFWIAMGVVTVAEIFGHFIAEQIQGDRLSAIVDLAFTYPEFAVAAKRGQDRNMPLWLIGAFFAAGVLLDLLTVVGLAGTDDAPSAFRWSSPCRSRCSGSRFWSSSAFAGARPGRTATGRTRSGRKPCAARLNRLHWRSDLTGE